MSKKALLLGVCLTLSACVVYAPTYVKQTEETVVHNAATSSQNVRIEQETKEVSERVDPKVTRRSGQRSLAVCGTFALPREAKKPRYLTDVELATAADLNMFDEMVARKMKELQTYIDKLDSDYEQAHNKWMETCSKKLLN